jgi:hypothetical protein
MSDMEERCCGSDVCIIDQAGRCWCGQVWNGTRMVMPDGNLQSQPLVCSDTPTEQERRLSAKVSSS